jgi:predicted nuclease with TOPRIM domain
MSDLDLIAQNYNAMRDRVCELEREIEVLKDDCLELEEENSALRARLDELEEVEA